MENSPNRKRSRRLMMWLVIAIMLVARVIMAVAKGAPESYRDYCFLGGLGLLVLPVGFIYGRNAGRIGDMGKMSRLFGWMFAVSLLVGFFPGKGMHLFAALGSGGLAGFAIGSTVRKRTEETLGDTEEAQEVLNPAATERELANKAKHLAYIDTLDPPARKRLRVLQAIEGMSAIAGMPVVFWILVADKITLLTRALYVHKGDNVVVFITLDPLIVFVPMVLVTIFTVGLVCESLMPRLAGAYIKEWREFARLRRSKGGSSSYSRANQIFALVLVCLSIPAILLFIDSYVKVTDNGVAINSYFGVGERYYTWDKVRDAQVSWEAQVNKDGELRKRLNVDVTFTDGTHWSPDTSFARRTPDIESAGQYIAQKIGKQQ